MAKNSQALALPDNVFSLLADADKRKGFPPGTMQSLLMQETGGQAQYLNDPTTYHYAANADGKRIAPQSGKISTAQGPFGILESTAKDPGYGVKPMGDRTNLGEHIRFSADYLDARAKSAGSLPAGLAGYGEGEKYAAQVARRRDGQAPVVAQVAQTPAVLPVQDQPVVAQAAPAPVQVAAAPAEQVVAQAVPPVAQDPGAWDNFVTNLRAAQNQPVVQAPAPQQQMTYQGLQVPNFMAALGVLGDPQANFQSFGSFGNRRARG